MKWLVYFFAALFVAITIGTVISYDPGRLVLVWGGWTLETSAIFSVSALLLAAIFIHLVLKLLRSLLRLPDLIRRWRGDRRSLQAEELLARGLQRMLTGQWRLAERDFSRWAARGCDPSLGYVYAAQAADAQGAERRRDHYLQQAADANRDATGLTLALARAALLPDLPQGRLDLERLAATGADAGVLPQVRKLQLASALERGAWVDAQQVFAAMKNSGEMPADRAAVLEWRIAAGTLSAVAGEDRLKVEWSRLASGLRREPGLIAVYVRQRLRHGPSPDCETLLSDALAQAWDPVLAELFGQVQGAKPERQLRIAEGWLRRHGRDADLLLTLGRLAQRAGQGDQARVWLEESLQIRPGPEACGELGRILEQQGNVVAALKYYRQAVGFAVVSSGVSST